MFYWVRYIRFSAVTFYSMNFPPNNAKDNNFINFQFLKMKSILTSPPINPDKHKDTISSWIDALSTVFKTLSPSHDIPLMDTDDLLLPQ
jgi:hypothetical protein